MATNRTEANRAMLDKASETQDKTKELVKSIQKQALESENLANLTLEELTAQGLQMDEINAELDTVGKQLEKTQVLQNQFDRWAGNFFGGKKNAAIKAAGKALIKDHCKDDETSTKIREVFEVEKFDSISRIWRPQDVYLCSNPAVAAKEVFNPKNAKDDSATWLIDYSIAGIDAEGWTYGYDNNTLIKNGSGDSSRKWNSYARRRKWRLEEKKAASNLATISAVRERQAQRGGVISASGGSGREKEKITYVPRGKSGLTASGLTSAGMMGRNGTAPDQTLDEESQARLDKLKKDDEEIDQGLDGISTIIGNLDRIAGNMNSEVRKQTLQADKIEKNMDRDMNAQAIVNARLKSLVKHS